MRASGISIWFFVGISLVVNGALITGAGIWELFDPPEHRVVLFQLHAGIWWGAVLFVVGVIYCIRSAPWRRSSDETHS